MIINKTFIININIVAEISNSYFNNHYLFIDIDYIDYIDYESEEWEVNIIKCSTCLLCTVSAEVIDGFMEEFDSCACDDKAVKINIKRNCDHFVPLPDKDSREWFV